jgi:DNA-binding transcriptional LysR family regulator
MTELRLLKHFVTVYRTQSFRVGAEELGISQSTLTKSIARLENHLGVRLFNRTTRMVEPTDTARQLLPMAESTLASAGLFDEEARMLAGGKLGSIRVGAIALAAETLIVDALVQLTNSHPELEVEVVVGGSDIYRDLATGTCDVAVGDEANFANSPHALSLRMEPISTERLVLVHRTGHRARGAPDIADFLRFPLAIPSRYFNENRLFETIAARADTDDFPRYRLNSLSACLMLAARSDVVTLAPASVVERLLGASQQPIEIATADPEISIHLALVTASRNAPTPAIRAFKEAVSRH